jgi:hypothetical protein
MLRKIVIVVTGVILAILAISFFATGLNLGGKPLVIHEEKYISSYDQRVYFDNVNYALTCTMTTINIEDKRTGATLLTLPAYDDFLDPALRRNKRNGGIVWSCVTPGAREVHAIVPKEYTVTYSKYRVNKTKMYPGDFYLLSILCLIGLSFLAMYAAFTSRRK